MSFLFRIKQSKLIRAAKVLYVAPTFIVICLIPVRLHQELFDSIGTASVSANLGEIPGSDQQGFRLRIIPETESISIEGQTCFPPDAPKACRVAFDRTSLAYFTRVTARRDRAYGLVRYLTRAERVRFWHRALTQTIGWTDLRGPWDGLDRLAQARSELRHSFAPTPTSVATIGDNLALLSEGKGAVVLLTPEFEAVRIFTEPPVQDRAALLGWLSSIRIEVLPTTSHNSM